MRVRVASQSLRDVRQRRRCDIGLRIKKVSKTPLVWVEVESHQTHYRSYRGRFLRVK